MNHQYFNFFASLLFISKSFDLAKTELKPLLNKMEVEPFRAQREKRQTHHLAIRTQNFT